MVGEAPDQAQHQGGLARSRLSEENGQTVALFDGIAQLVEWHLMHFAEVVGRIVIQTKRLVAKAVVLEIHVLFLAGSGRGLAWYPNSSLCERAERANHRSPDAAGAEKSGELGPVHA